MKLKYVLYGILFSILFYIINQILAQIYLVSHIYVGDPFELSYHAYTYAALNTLSAVIVVSTCIIIKTIKENK